VRVEWRMRSALGILVGDDGELASWSTRWETSTSLPSTLPPSAALARPRADGRGDLADGDRVVEFPDRAVRERDVDHVVIPPSKMKKARTPRFPVIQHEDASPPTGASGVGRSWRSHNHGAPFACRISVRQIIALDRRRGPRFPRMAQAGGRAA
jgi:hypothetical protein